MMSWRDGRRKLRLKHQRFMLTLDRQLSAVLAGVSGQASASAASDLPLSSHPQATGVPDTDDAAVPGAHAASQAGVQELGAAAASVSGGDADIADAGGRRGCARTASGCLERTHATAPGLEQGRPARPRPASAPSVLQRATEVAVATSSGGQTSAGAAWLPAPSLRPAASATALSADVHPPWHTGRTSVDPTSNSPTVAHMISSFGGPAWGATEVCRPVSGRPEDRSSCVRHAANQDVLVVCLLYAPPLHKRQPEVAAVGAGRQGPVGLGAPAGVLHRDASHPCARPACQRRPGEPHSCASDLCG